MAFDLDDDELRETRKMKNLDRELIVGEYVRTKDGKIGIFKGYNNNRKSQWACKVELQNMKLWKYYEEENIVKHNKQLIELAENKDILKLKDSDSKEVFFIGVDEDTSDVKYEEIITDIRNGENELLGILTSQQFEADYYKVGGKNK